MKNFTVNIGGQTMTMPGPDNATQEQAQAEAERQMQAKQAADVQRDFRGPGHVVANIAQGGAELVGGPAQLLGATPGPRYQQAEKEPTTFGDKAARVAGAALPLAPLGATGATIPRVVGAAEGASVPADSNTQRAINTGIGAFTGGFGRGSGDLERLAATLSGGWMGLGHGGWIPALLGGSLGHEAHHAVANLLRQFPPSVVARAITQLGGPYTKSIADSYDAMPGSKPQPPQQ